MRSNKVFSLLEVVYLSLLLFHCLAVPIGRVMGCGKEDPDLSPEQRKFCCESFSLDCEESDLGSNPSQDKPQQESFVKRQTIYERLAPKRKLGSPCQEPIFSCAVGLECRKGLCRRVRSQEHLESLLERGKEVEREEKEDLEDEDGLEPSRRKEKDGGLTLYGQSVSVDHVYRRGMPMSTRYASNIDKSEKRNEVFYGATARIMGTERDNGVVDGTSSAFEEDEVAANVADLIASRLHISLNASQVHSIRDIIAGTLDERAEREDEADRTALTKLDNALQLTRHTDRTDGKHNTTCTAPFATI